MFVQTPAIVLHSTPYNDRYTIVHFYTQARGRLGVLVPNSRKSKQKHHLLLTNLAEIELTVEIKPRRELAFLSEARVISPHHGIQLHPAKCSQAIFISELLYRTLMIPSPDEALYQYLSSTINLLDTLEQGVANFYLCFTLHLLHFLAISPELNDIRHKDGLYFDLSEACYTSIPRQQSHYLLPLAESAHLRYFVRMNFRNLYAFKYNRHHRAIILDWLMLYYQLHLPSFIPLKSIPILRSGSRG